MDDYMFKSYVKGCKNVTENTSFLEIYNYSDPTRNSIEEHSLKGDDFLNWIKQRGTFAPEPLPEGVTMLHGLRLVLQLNASQPETFTPNYISFTGPEYESMVRNLRLPFRAIEGMSVVGPFFWSAFDQDDDDPHLQIVFRKSDVRKKGKTRGWELMLSHSFRTGVTTGYAKGTESSDLVESIRHLKACAGQIAHPLLLPIIILSHDLSPKNETKQREAREWLRRLEHAVSMRNEIVENEGYVNNMIMDMDAINRDLVECHSQVLWKRPQAYKEIIRSIEHAMDRFVFLAGVGRRFEARYGGKGSETHKLHRSMHARLDFYRAKLSGIENYAHTTLERLEVQRGALYNIIAQKESKLNLEMAGQQRRLAVSSKRDSNSMKTLSLLGAIFLPATYLASVFSMTFFNFQDPDDPHVISNWFWVYFVVTIPFTLAIVAFWRWWDRRREGEYAKEDEDLEKGIDQMEMNIMAMMRKRTLTKERTWNVPKVKMPEMEVPKLE